MTAWQKTGEKEKMGRRPIEKVRRRGLFLAELKKLEKNQRGERRAKKRRCGAKRPIRRGGLGPSKKDSNTKDEVGRKKHDELIKKKKRGILETKDRFAADHQNKMGGELEKKQPHRLP